MKLLLTSNGITNESIAESFLSLACKPASSLKLAFIPTAGNAEGGNKADWLFRQYEGMRHLGINWIDMVDFAAADVDWRSRLDACDVLYLSGGNTFYLLDQIRKSGFGDYLQGASAEKVYVGSSASSITMTPRIDVAAMPPGDLNLPGLQDLTGLGFVNFEIEPHCHDDRFPVVEAYARQNARKIYAIDDQTAIQVVDGVPEVVSEGKWKFYDNP